jgi:hypothetical protein
MAGRVGRWIALIGAVVLLGGCSPSAPSRPTPTDPGTPAFTPTPPSPSPTAVPPTTGTGIAAMPASDTPMRPGRYTNPTFDPTVAFRVGEGWIAGHELADFFDVQQPNTVVVFSRPSYVYDRQGVRRPVDGPARAALTTVAANPLLHPGPIRPASVDGIAGASVRLNPTGMAGLFGGEFPYTTAAGTSYRLTFLRVAGNLVAVMAVARQRPFAGSFAEAERVIRSISFA